MTIGAQLSELRESVARLNAEFRHHGATSVIEATLTRPEFGRIAMVSSFGAESVALLHLIAVVDRSTPVIFVDTRMLFTETLVYQAEVAERLGLKNVSIISASDGDIAKHDPKGTLHRADPDACCAFRKTNVLENALTGFDGWFTGRKRFQSGARAEMVFFEIEDATGRIKVNPLAHWTSEDVVAYMDDNRLPRHPLVKQGYPSIGCAPCTTKVSKGENPRSGRWRGQAKDECGIHFVNGKVMPKGATA